MKVVLDEMEEVVTEGTLVGRLGRDSDVGAMVLLLCSEAGQFVDGATLVLDGGMITKSHL